ncbi:MAG: dihydrodipicolinate synthase family protein [Candidatus Nanopelagicales bacterium]|nr:dihydrodipicolinate synthase family protein [Candidatus Nanopelagicales bacterium]MCF8539185.1 dihydrodipicolinate synthase family protein [Candidatus Nanopelagicales bacterium]MCF8551855.1 dihydrodipicolinate synthase family protein [Candidatus Nanopelagicales bacterium]
MPLRPEGVYVPLVTPFDSQGQVDTDQLRAAVRAMITAGVHGIVAAGTTGEGYALGFDERRHVLNTIVAEVAGELPILAGVGGMSTHEALDQALLAKRAGVTGLMLAAPSYCLPTQGELAQHVTTVVQAIDLPTVLYDYPARTGVSFTHAVLDSVATLPQIVGIKEASGDLTRLPWLQQDFGADLTVVCGADLDSITFLDAGVDCWIGGIANLLPAAHVAMMDPAQRPGVYSAIRPVLEFIESGDYNAKIKAGMGLRGLPVGPPRAPIAPVTSEVTELLEAALDAAESWAPSLVS